MGVRGSVNKGWEARCTGSRAKGDAQQGVVSSWSRTEGTIRDLKDLVVWVPDL